METMDIMQKAEEVVNTLSSWQLNAIIGIILGLIFGKVFMFSAHKSTGTYGVQPLPDWSAIWTAIPLGLIGAGFIFNAYFRSSQQISQFISLLVFIVLSVITFWFFVGLLNKQGRRK